MGDDGDGQKRERRRVRVAMAGFLAVAALAMGRAGLEAAELNWSEDPLPGLIVDEALETVLLQLSAHQGVKAIISDALDARVTLNFQGMTVDQAMDELAMAHQFDWFYDGRAVYFFPISSISQQVLRLEDYDVGRLVGVLEDLALIDRRYPIVGSEDANVALVTGPPQYIALIEQTMAAMVSEDPDENRDEPATLQALADLDMLPTADKGETTEPEPCPPLSRRAECLPRVTYGYGGVR